MHCRNRLRASPMTLSAINFSSISISGFLLQTSLSHASKLAWEILLYSSESCSSIVLLPDDGMILIDTGKTPRRHDLPILG